MGGGEFGASRVGAEAGARYMEDSGSASVLAARQDHHSEGIGTVMALFDDRKKGQESKFAHDQEALFKMSVRRNRLLGLWIASQMGKDATEADAYAKEVVAADFEKPGDDDVVQKVLADCKAAGIDMDEHKLRRHMQTLEEEARRQLQSE